MNSIKDPRKNQKQEKIYIQENHEIERIKQEKP